MFEIVCGMEINLYRYVSIFFFFFFFFLQQILWNSYYTHRYADIITNIALLRRKHLVSFSGKKKEKKNLCSLHTDFIDQGILYIVYTRYFSQEIPARGYKTLDHMHTKFSRNVWILIRCFLTVYFLFFFFLFLPGKKNCASNKSYCKQRTTGKWRRGGTSRTL